MRKSALLSKNLFISAKVAVEMYIHVSGLGMWKRMDRDGKQILCEDVHWYLFLFFSQIFVAGQKP